VTEHAEVVNTAADYGTRGRRRDPGAGATNGEDVCFDEERDAGEEEDEDEEDEEDGKAMGLSAQLQATAPLAGTTHAFTYMATPRQTAAPLRPLRIPSVTAEWLASSLLSILL